MDAEGLRALLYAPAPGSARAIEIAARMAGAYRVRIREIPEQAAFVLLAYVARGTADDVSAAVYSNRPMGVRARVRCVEVDPGPICVGCGAVKADDMLCDACDAALRLDPNYLDDL